MNSVRCGYVTSVKAAVIHWHRRENGDRIARVKLSAGRRHGSVDVCVPAALRLPRADAVERWVEDLAAELPAGDAIDLLAERSPLVWGENRMSA